jgi:hypothetical protein
MFKLKYRTGHVIGWMLYIVVVVVIVWLLDLQLPVQSVHITTKVVSSIEPRSWWGVIDTTLCDKVCQWLATGRCFYPGTPVFFTNKTDCHDITEILLALNTINQPKPTYNAKWVICQLDILWRGPDTMMMTTLY